MRLPAADPSQSAFPKAVEGIPRRLSHLNLSFLRNHRLKRMFALCGIELKFGLPKPGDGVVVWGASPTAWRGEKLAARYNAPLIRLEDSFLRSVKLGRMGAPPNGLFIDYGLHFDAATPSRIEDILAHHPLDDPDLMTRAALGIARLKDLHLSKYNLHDPKLPAPDAGYVLVVDQTLGDASLCGFGPDDFGQMIAAAKAAYPKREILIKTHPETHAGLRQGLWRPAHGGRPITAPLSPWALLQNAHAVYVISSQMGFEAILSGHQPHVWGSPFYAGWGLSQDRQTFPRRGRELTPEQLFAAAMLLAPLWYDAARDRLCNFEDAVNQLEAEARAFRQDRKGHIASAMRLWKRGPLQQFFGAEKPLVFVDDPRKAAERAKATGKGLLVWANKAPPELTALRVEDGFLRSRGLGAQLVPPLSLVADESGIYYDPSKPSDLEKLILAPLPAGGAQRAAALIAKLQTSGVTKYNLSGGLPELPQGRRILVPGQVEDDASILCGANNIRTNLALLKATRQENPDAAVIYKPHPDVMAGLRKGAIAPDIIAQYADITIETGDMATLLDQVDEVWTITSLTGFEALLRGKKVRCFGRPFYAGWGLTQDCAPIARRNQPRDLLHLAHAALIAYPRYWDPISRLPCPPEVAIERLAEGKLPHASRLNRLISKLQGRLANWAHLWR